MTSNTNRIYSSYEEFYQNDFHIEHSHPINRLLHFLGISVLYVALTYGLITFNLWFILLSPFSFIILSGIGHKLIERNDVISEEDKKYGIWPLRAAFTFTHRVYLGKENIFSKKIIKEN